MVSILGSFLPEVRPTSVHLVSSSLLLLTYYPLSEVSLDPVGGRLANVVQFWRTMTNDAFINSVVIHGFSLYPHQFSGVIREYTIYPGKVSALVWLEGFPLFY